MAQTDTHFSVSLRPVNGTQSEHHNDLIEKIRLINQQRDGFRNVRQDSLEVEKHQVDEAESSEGESEGEDEEDKKGTMEKVFEKRVQMQQSLHSALWNSLFTLDSLSLTASSILDNSFQTASPLLKDAVPPKSFSIAKREPGPQPSGQERERKKNRFWSGASMTADTDAAGSLLAAATRLEGLVKAETEYWGELLSLTSKGWPVYKPGPQEAMHVKFVATEATPLFSAKGVARLLPGEDGRIKLGKGIGNEPQTLRLRFSRDREVVASSITASLLSLADLGSSLEDKVRREQSSLFEEELFQEMVMESRVLQPLGVKLRDKVLHIPAARSGLTNANEEYLIDLIPTDQASDLLNASDNHYKDMIDAQSVMLRLLMCHVYHQRLERRSRPPEPMSGNSGKPKASNIIRSFIALMEHFSACRPLSAYLRTVNTVMSNAGMPLKCDEVGVPGLHEILADVTASPPASLQKQTIHKLLAHVEAPQKTVTRMHFQERPSTGPCLNHEVILRVTTDLSAPMFGTEYTVELPQALAKLKYGRDSNARSATFTNIADLQEFLNYLINMQIAVQLLSPKCQGWDLHPDMPILTKRSVHPQRQPEFVIGVNFEGHEIKLQNRRMGARKGQDLAVWTETTPSNESKSLMVTFEAWINEA